MKNKKNLVFLCALSFALTLTMSACNFGGKKNNNENPSDESETSQPSSQGGGEQTQKWTVTFDSQGGSSVASQKVEHGKTATKPADPTRDNYSFLGWYEESAAITEFDFATPITANRTLYAGWKASEVVPPDPPQPPVEDADFYVAIGGTNFALVPNEGASLLANQLAEYKAEVGSVKENDSLAFLDSNKEEITTQIGPNSGDNNGVGEAGAGFYIHNDADNVIVYFQLWDDGGHSFWVTGYSKGDTPVDPSGAHGPEGSTLVSWYIVGKGSLFDVDWSIDHGIQLFSNPSSETDKGCILYLYIEAGNVFKVTNGTDWYGYDKVDKWDDPSNLGLHNFSAVDDGYGGSNIQCDVDGYYDIYVNQSGNFWIQAAADLNVNF